MSKQPTIVEKAGDRLEVHGRQGTPSRRGTIIEIIGLPGHEHYRVRWDEDHESLFFPDSGEGVHVVHPEPHHKPD